MITDNPISKQMYLPKSTKSRNSIPKSSLNVISSDWHWFSEKWSTASIILWGKQVAHVDLLKHWFIKYRWVKLNQRTSSPWVWQLGVKSSKIFNQCNCFYCGLETLHSQICLTCVLWRHRGEKQKKNRKRKTFYSLYSPLTCAFTSLEQYEIESTWMHTTFSSICNLSLFHDTV